MSVIMDFDMTLPKTAGLGVIFPYSFPRLVGKERAKTASPTAARSGEKRVTFTRA